MRKWDKDSIENNARISKGEKTGIEVKRSTENLSVDMALEKNK